MDITIVRSKRKTLAIQVVSPTAVLVRAPLWISQGHIEKVLHAKEPWIRRAQLQVRTRKKIGYVPGQQFWYLGARYPLRVSDQYFRTLRFTDNLFLVSSYFVRHTQRLFTAWYKEQAMVVLAKRVAHWSRIMGLEYKSVRITSARSRWGSCSRLGNINFSVRLIALPMEIIDYVVVHELAHIEHHNHGPRFWGAVLGFYPSVVQARNFLKNNTMEI